MGMHTSYFYSAVKYEKIRAYTHTKAFSVYSVYQVHNYLITSYGCLGMGSVDKQQDTGVD